MFRLLFLHFSVGRNSDVDSSGHPALFAELFLVVVGGYVHLKAELVLSDLWRGNVLLSGAVYLVNIGLLTARRRHGEPVALLALVFMMALIQLRLYGIV